MQSRTRDAEDDHQQCKPQQAANLHAAVPVEEGKAVRYPGEQTLKVRQENMELGVPVDEELWRQLVAQDY